MKRHQDKFQIDLSVLTLESILNHKSCQVIEVFRKLNYHLIKTILNLSLMNVTHSRQGFTHIERDPLSISPSACNCQSYMGTHLILLLGLPVYIGHPMARGIIDYDHYGHVNNTSNWVQQLLNEHDIGLTAPGMIACYGEPPPLHILIRSIQCAHETIH